MYSLGTGSLIVAMKNFGAGPIIIMLFFGLLYLGLIVALAIRFLRRAMNLLPEKAAHREENLPIGG